MLQPRDREILAAVFAHRYLTARHLHALLFRGRALRVMQARLRKLFEHGFVGRRFLPVVIGEGLRPGRAAGEPLYCLDRAGAIALGEEINLDPARIPHTPSTNADGYATLEHNLIVTDLIVALAAACRDHATIRLASFQRETTLRRLVYTWRERHRDGVATVPDGAFTLEYGPNARRSTFYVEVVRAGVKAGNATLGDRMGRYVTLLRSGFFREVYGHEHVRAVLILTTTSRRAEALRRVARKLRHGTRLFWFGALDEGDSPPRFASLDPASILARSWTTTDGDSLSFISVGSAPSAPRR